MVAAVFVAGSLAACADDGPGPKAGPPTSTTPATSSPATPSGSASWPSPPAQEPPPKVTLTVAGDLMLVRGVPDARQALAPMAELLRAADLTVGNLEQTLSTDGEPTQGGDSFGGSPADLDLLRRAGFDAVSLANNHSGDYGERALLQTVDRFEEGPVRAFGAGRTARAAARPLVLEARGTRFAFLGFNAIGETPMATATTPGALSVRMPPRTGPLQQADLDRVTAAIRRADRLADAVVVLPHWGEQYTHEPWPDQHRVARALVDAGADLVVGGHPHWVQGVEQVGRVPVLHSLGNFVFDMGWEPQVIQGVVLETTWTGGELTSLRLVPYAIDPVTFAPTPASPVVARDILGDVRSTSTGPLARCLTSSPSRRDCTP